MNLQIKHFNKKKRSLMRGIAHLNKMDYPLNMMRLHHVFIGYVDGTPVCFLGLNQRFGNYYFRGCYVLPKFRGNGFQKKLLRFAFHEMKLWGIEKVTSLIDYDNWRSLNNALEVGFKIDGMRNKKSNYHIIKIL